MSKLMGVDLNHLRISHGKKGGGEGEGTRFRFDNGYHDPGLLQVDFL